MEGVRGRQYAQPSPAGPTSLLTREPAAYLTGGEARYAGQSFVGTAAPRQQVGAQEGRGPGPLGTPGTPEGPEPFMTLEETGLTEAPWRSLHGDHT